MQNAPSIHILNHMRGALASLARPASLSLTRRQARLSLPEPPRLCCRDMMPTVIRGHGARWPTMISSRRRNLARSPFGTHRPSNQSLQVGHVAVLQRRSAVFLILGRGGSPSCPRRDFG